jgi:hypothetical protein
MRKKNEPDEPDKFWFDLIYEVELQTFEKDASLYNGEDRFSMLESDSFKIAGQGVVVIARRYGQSVVWRRITMFGSGVIPVKTRGILWFSSGKLWDKGRKFSCIRQAALYLIDLSIREV